MAKNDLTEVEQQAVDAWVKCGSKAAAARTIGMSSAGCKDAIARAEQKGWKKPMVDVDIPESMAMAKTTVQYNAKGEVVQEWRRLQQERVFSEEFVKSLIKQVKGKARVPKHQGKADSDSCFELCAYDLHFGMYAAKVETGDDNYDTDIAAQRLLDSSAYLISKAGKPKVARLVLGGDQLHCDNNQNKTPLSGNILDADARYGLVIKKLVTACREAVTTLSRVAQTVEIYVIAGNHDPISSLWLAQTLEAYYSNTRRVKVCGQMTPRKYAVWGNCLSVYAHGHMVKMDKWANVIAAEKPELWGSTKFRYARLGHIHTKKTVAPVVVNESPGLEVTYLSSLASSDAWHSESGYVGNTRGMQAFELHKELGEVARYNYNVG